MGTENYLPQRKVGNQARGVPEAKREKFQGGKGPVTSHAVERYSMVGTEDHPLDSATVTTLDRSVPAEQRGQKPVGSECGYGLLESQEDEPTSPEFCRCTTSGAWVTFFIVPSPPQCDVHHRVGQVSFISQSAGAPSLSTVNAPVCSYVTRWRCVNAVDSGIFSHIFGTKGKSHFSFLTFNSFALLTCSNGRSLAG